MKSSWIKVIAFAAIALVSVSVILFLRSSGYGLETLLAERDRLLVLVENNRPLSALGFVAAYILVVAFSIPGATVLTLLGGFFFGPILGTMLVNVGATTGALLVFLAARYLLRDTLMAKYGSPLGRLNKELEANGANYLLTLRFIPLFPFFLINLLAGLTPVSVLTYVWTTSVGIIPGSLVYALLGSSGAELGSSGTFSTTLAIALVLLGAVSVIPVVVKKIAARKAK